MDQVGVLDSDEPGNFSQAVSNVSVDIRRDARREAGENRGDKIVEGELSLKLAVHDLLHAPRRAPPGGGGYAPPPAPLANETPSTPIHLHSVGAKGKGQQGQLSLPCPSASRVGPAMDAGYAFITLMTTILCDVLAHLAFEWAQRLLASVRHCRRANARSEAGKTDGGAISAHFDRSRRGHSYQHDSG